ncbi:hypothetical protein [Kineococcus radiotolerans]|uniref:hypothetical protein n=1 Tax=Kineococcus radiotolerans TaxID=131568 RepID=UPI00003A3F2C|nr:hypothetical protein [Kineococcus radiotolerans]
MLDTAVVPASSVPASWRGWAGVRAVLLVLTAVVVLAALVRGEHGATLRDLQDDVGSGRVSRVQVTGDLPPGTTGTARQEVRWRSGWRTHQVEVQLVAGPLASGTGGTTMTGDDGSPLPVTRQDVGALVRSWDPQVRVDRTGYPSASYSATVLGLEVPGWVGLLTLLQWLGAVLLLIHGPEPRWVSRWGWFWSFALPFGVTAFLLSSGPLPGRRYVAPGPGRLRGGRAFVVSLLLAGALGGSGAL